MSINDTTENWFRRHKTLVGVIVFLLIAAALIIISGRDKNQAIESSNTGVSSGVNDGEEAVPPKETQNY